MDKVLSDRIDILSAYMGSPLTEEQKEFASDFTKNTMSFSDPGTGKTHSTIAGLVLAQTHYGVPGKRINCMSFTNAAVSEIKARYDALCKHIMITPNVEFNTFHSLSNTILREAFHGKMNVRAGLVLNKDVPAFLEMMNEIGLDCNDYNYAKSVLYAINALNSSLTYDPKSIEESYKFKKLGMEVEHFQLLRKKWFLRCLTLKSITQGDIPLYCLYALIAYPEMVKNWHGRYDIMVVDEFQDLSLLHLKILSLITSKLVVIGDIKQQIYGFNGACAKIIDEYKKCYPDARFCPLSQSFRCKSVIADFATKVIAPNKMSFTEFKGVSEGGQVNLYSRRELDWQDIIKGIKEDIDAHTLAGAKDVLFLYRNNASAVPVMEQLYQMKVPFRSTKFKKVMDLPIFEDLCKMADVAADSGNIEKVETMLRMLPEYQKLPFAQQPTPVQIMKQTGKDIFNIPFAWNNTATKEVMVGIRRAQMAIEKGASASVVLNHCLKVYEEYVIHGEWWRFDMDKEFYLNLVGPILVNKTYQQMVSEEWDKQKVNTECIQAGVGVRCYTMHASKGLEADHVYILDAEDKMFPNQKEMSRMIEAGCTYEAACRLRDERNLLFVAVTRAKELVTISYSGEPTELLVHPDDTKYDFLDEIYENHNNEFDDVRYFAELFNLTEK